MLTIHCNENFIQERKYIFYVVFGYFWGLDYQIKFEERRDILISDHVGKELRLADTFLQMEKEDWLMGKSLPLQPLLRLPIPNDYRKCTTDEILPIIYGDKEQDSGLFSADERYCSLDIFGSALFMLTRYEEIVKNERDRWGRFPANASIAFQENFLERPIVNEYLEILWQWLTKHFKGLKRKSRSFLIMPTHDVDFPFWNMAFKWSDRIRRLAGAAIKHRDFCLVKQNVGYMKNAIVGDFDKDPHNTFDTIMDISEEQDLISNFYFMTSVGRDEKDGNYDITHPEIRKLVKKMLSRGHKIGIHPGFGSMDKPQYIKEDVDKLRNMLAKENMSVEKIGGRQHYLHWCSPYTWQHYDQVGIEYDASLSYADHIGFRCGICYDYPAYNVITHERYKLREYPLIIMDCSGLGEGYMHLSHEEMLARCLSLKGKVQKYQGTFVILWHNTYFIKPEDIACYKHIMRC